VGPAGIGACAAPRGPAGAARFIQGTLPTALGPDGLFEVGKRLVSAVIAFLASVGMNRLDSLLLALQLLTILVDFYARRH
jgi:hypothetical protein